MPAFVAVGRSAGDVLNKVHPARANIPLDAVSVLPRRKLQWPAQGYLHHPMRRFRVPKDPVQIPQSFACRIFYVIGSFIE